MGVGGVGAPSASYLLCGVEASSTWSQTVAVKRCRQLSDFKKKKKNKDRNGGSELNVGIAAARELSDSRRLGLIYSRAANGRSFLQIMAPLRRSSSALSNRGSAGLFHQPSWAPPAFNC